MPMWLRQLPQDIRFGVRSFLRTPGFTTLAVLSLALGIMATTAMYSVIHAVVLDPFPYKDVDALMSVKSWNPKQQGFRTYYTTDEFLEFAERSTIFRRRGCIDDLRRALDGGWRSAAPARELRNAEYIPRDGCPGAGWPNLSS